MAEIVAVADFTPVVRAPEDIAAPPARRKAHPGPKARVNASPPPSPTPSRT